MASTYSNNLKIQLMTTGENNTTWGAVTNTNLGTAIEEAITSSGTVTFASTDVTLTLNNSNASQAARKLRLTLNGTTGGATRVLTVPDVEKIYILNNTCADSIRVGNSEGSRVTVPPGKTMWVYSTGSNVISPTSHIPSLSVGATPSPVVTEAASQTLTNKILEAADLGANSTATTQSLGDNSTKVATTAYVDNTAGNLADMASQSSDNVNITGGTISGVTITGGSGEGSIGTNALGNRTISADQPTGGADGDIWYQI